MKEYLRKLEKFLSLKKEEQTIKEAIFLYKQMEYYNPTIMAFRKWKVTMWENKITKKRPVSISVVIRCLSPLPAKIKRYIAKNPQKDGMHRKFLKKNNQRPSKGIDQISDTSTPVIKTVKGGLDALKGRPSTPSPSDQEKKLAYHFRHKKKNLRHIREVLPENVIDMTALEIEQQINDKSNKIHIKIKEYVKKALEHSKEIDTILKPKKAK